MTTPAASEPSVLADGFLGIAFRRLREGLLPHMRAVLGDDYETEIGGQRTRRTVRLTDDADLYDLLQVWYNHRRTFIDSFTSGRQEHAPGLNWPETINEFRSDKWARQRPYTDDEVGRILDTIAAMLAHVGAAPQAEAVEYLASEFETYLYQRSQLTPPDAPDDGNGAGLSPAEVAAGHAITARPGEPDVFAEGFLTRAWRRLGRGLGPYMERRTGRRLDNPHDVSEILAGNLNRVDRSIYRECSSLLEARNKWAHQGRYQYRNVRLTLTEISQVLQAISENELAQEVDRMRADLSRLHIAARRPDAPAPPDDHAAIAAIPFRPEQLIAGLASAVLTSLATPEFHSALSALAGAPFAPPVPYPVAAAPTSSIAVVTNLNTDAAQDLESASDYFERGEVALQSGEFDLAIANFDTAIGINPQYADAYRRRGAAYSTKGEYDRAIADFDAALRINPQDSLAYNSRGDAYYAKGDYDLAIADYTAALVIDPQDSLAYNSRGDAYYAKGDYDLAIADYTAALVIDPQDDFTYNSRGDAYWSKSDYDLAIADYTAALAINPQEAFAYNNRGIAYWSKGDYDLAIADYTAALAINPQDTFACNSRGIAYWSKGDYDLAIADYTAFLAINPQDDFTYFFRGTAYSSKGDHDLAIADYDATLRLNPQNSRAYSNRGDAYYAKGNYGRAISDYTSALTIDPLQAGSYNNRGLAYYSKGEYDRAIADYTVALGIDPQDAGAYNNRGLAYSCKGEYDRAIADYTAALGIDPQDTGAYNNRGLAYFCKGDHDRAIADYTVALGIDPQDAGIYINRGNAHLHLVDYDQAIADWDAATALTTDDEMLQWLREVREYVVHIRDAQTEYDQAIADTPDDPDAWHLRGLHYRDDREDYDRAIADFTQALSLTTAGAEILCDRARTHQLQGSADQAMADYGEAIARRPDYAEAYYELGIIRTRRPPVPGRHLRL